MSSRTGRRLYTSVKDLKTVSAVSGYLCLRKRGVILTHTGKVVGK